MENSSTNENELSAYKAPEAELVDQQNAEDSTPFFPVSIKKLSVMYIFTLGLYGLVWFYHNWKLQAHTVDKKIYPVWRAIFSIFFTYSLFERVHKKSQDIGMPDWPYKNLAGIYVIFVIISNLADRVIEAIEPIKDLSALAFLLIFVALYPLSQVQKRVNEINEDPTGQLNGKFSGLNILFIVLGGLWWGLIILGSVFLMMGDVQ